MRARSGALLALAIVGCGGGVVPRPPPPPPPAGPVPAPKFTQLGDTVSVLNLVPMNRWPAVNGHVEGVLFRLGEQPWGASINWAQQFDLRDPSPGFGFSFDGHPMYVPSIGPPPPGVTALAQIVAIDGAAPAGSQNSFRVGVVRVLSRTAAVPIDPEATLVALRRRFDEICADHADALDRELAEVRAASKPDGEVIDTLEDETYTAVGISPSWYVADRELRVLFVYRAGGYRRERLRRPMRCGPCDPVYGCAQCDPGVEIEQDERRDWGVEMGALYRVGADGTVLEEIVYRPRRTIAAFARL